MQHLYVFSIDIKGLFICLSQFKYNPLKNEQKFYSSANYGNILAAKAIHHKISGVL